VLCADVTVFLCVSRPHRYGVYLILLCIGVVVLEMKRISAPAKTAAPDTEMAQPSKGKDDAPTPMSPEQYSVPPQVQQGQLTASAFLTTQPLPAVPQAQPYGTQPLPAMPQAALPQAQPYAMQPLPTLPQPLPQAQPQPYGTQPLPAMPQAALPQAQPYAMQPLPTLPQPLPQAQPQPYGTQPLPAMPQGGYTQPQATTGTTPAYSQPPQWGLPAAAPPQ